jgi:predicted aspartyl protease
MTIRARERIINLPAGATDVARFSVTITIANNDDVSAVRQGHLTPDKVRKLTIEGVVDTGAARLVLPQSVATRLGLPIQGTSRVRYADQRVAERQVAQSVWLEVLGRDSVFKAILEPDRTDALIGAIVLEDLDLIVDCTAGKLLPRDPTTIITDIE